MLGYILLTILSYVLGAVTMILIEATSRSDDK